MQNGPGGRFARLRATTSRYVKIRTGRPITSAEVHNGDNTKPTRPLILCGIETSICKRLFCQFRAKVEWCSENAIDRPLSLNIYIRLIGRGKRLIGCKTFSTRVQLTSKCAIELSYSNVRCISHLEQYIGILLCIIYS